MAARSDTIAVRVRAPARLHLGFLDLDGGLGRRFGSIGLAVDRPATDLVLARAESTSASGPDSDRARRLLERYRGALGIEGHHRLDVGEAIPAHAGLGSGTQLALAVGQALARLAGMPAAADELAGGARRGVRSAIGMAAFAEGGFLVDGGKGSRDDAPPPLLVRMPFPEQWRALLVLDPRAEGVHGEAETAAFAALAPLAASATAHVCRLVLMRLLPAVAEHDLASFGAALTEIQEIVGGHFAAAQGGSAWTSPKVGRLLARLAEAGAVGIGQSSWGPTGFAFVASSAIADGLYQSLEEAAKRDGLEILIVAGRNTGARIEEVHLGRDAEKGENK
jgi:beta-RFAP synthase